MNLTTGKNLLIILLVLVNCSIVNASEIVSIQSLDIKPYNNALSGFEHACNCDVKRLVVSEMHGMDIVKKIHKEKPEIILAIGIEALKRVGGIENIPVIYLMVLSPESVVAGKDNITGIRLYITPQRQLAVIKQALPDVSSIGLLYDPARTGNFIKQARRAAAAEGIKLIDKKTHNSKNVSALLKEMKGKIDAFWMLPDLTVITPETVELLLLFSIENGISFRQLPGNGGIIVP
jgi:putative ABC transport system substrate-binding protein